MEFQLVFLKSSAIICEILAGVKLKNTAYYHLEDLFHIYLAYSDFSGRNFVDGSKILQEFQLEFY